VKLLLLNSAGRHLMVVELKLHGVGSPNSVCHPNAGNRQSLLLWKTIISASRIFAMSEMTRNAHGLQCLTWP